MSSVARPATRLAVLVAGPLLAAVILWWWVVPKHAFDGPVVWSLARSRGVHLGDLFGVLIAGVVLYRSIAFAWRGTLRPRRGRPDAHSRSTDS